MSSTARTIKPMTLAAATQKREIHKITLPWPCTSSTASDHSPLALSATHKAQLEYLERIVEKQRNQLLLQGEVIKELKRVVMKTGIKVQRKGNGMMELLGDKQGQKERYDPL